MGEKSKELGDELEQPEKPKPRAITPRRLAAILAQVQGSHPAHARLEARATVAQHLPVPTEVDIPKRTHPSKAERRAARRKEQES